MITWREQLAFAPLASIERGEEIGRRLRHAIEVGVLEDGMQLPSENELAGRMGVSTLTLRAALAELRSMGLIETRRGKGGGSFVKANTGDIARAQRESLSGYEIEDLRDIRDYHVFLAGAAAAAAAENSQHLSLGRLASMATIIAESRQPADITRADSRFHIELAATSGSSRLTRQEMAMQTEVGPLIWSADLDRAEAAAAEHAAIVDAIRCGNVSLARALAEKHVREDWNVVIDRRMALDFPLFESADVEGSADRAISSIASFATMLKETVASTLRVIEEAVHVHLSQKGTQMTDDALIYDAARRSLSNAVPLLQGAGFIADPLFFGQPSIAWCFTPSGPESRERHDIDLEYYDIASAPWYPDAETKDDEIHASVAYVDASGITDKTVTFSKWVTVDEKRVGIVAADVLIKQLQTRFQPQLHALPQNTCIVDQAGGVIATNTGRYVGGTYRPASGNQEPVPLPGLPWRLCLGTQPERDSEE